ncbi:MAG: hypothetical protein LBK67_01650 [Coriobacteriales bacterium]|jgi:anaerobic dimethyl sulfoxide reductase subunit B (iron-sulfur subunit)|nr:hypothetical protein [Coriobacteriales bacterium]
MSRYGLLIDYDYCCGCHTCEIACQKEHGYKPGEFGITVQQIGPWPIRDTKRHQFDYLPFPTQLCNLCARRTVKGKAPICVQHCVTDCMRYGTVQELAVELETKPRQVLFVPQTNWRPDSESPVPSPSDCEKS